MARATTPRTARQTLAVVMGDIIDSEGRRAGGELSREFNSAIRAANKKYRAPCFRP